MIRPLALAARLLPALAPVSGREKLRAALGALIGIALTGWVSRWALGPEAGVPLLIAPMGASAVLLFAVPSSPLAQPWSILGGNIVAALIGVACARLVPDVPLACAVAVAASIGAMLLLRCLHPPSGAVALTAVLGGPAVAAVGYGFVLAPVALNSLLLLAAALAFNNLTGRRYPHLSEPAGTARSPASTGAPRSFADGDLDAVLAKYGQVLDVSRDELAGLFNAARLRAYERRSGTVRCADIMTRRAVAVAPGTPLREAWELLRAHRFRALPVTGEDARVLGIVTQTDFLAHADWSPGGPRLGLVRRLRQAARLAPAPDATVDAIMSRPARTVTAQTSIAELVPLMADAGVHQMPVVDERRQLVGIVTQSDLIAALFRDVETAH
ncbi:MAG: HPP family protein [Xanthobacteraceae bacterium]